METVMKKFAAGIAMLYLAVGATGSLWAGEKALSPQAQELKSLLASLKEKPEDRGSQTQYLLKFPRDIESFRRLFGPPDFSELYDGADYIFALRDLADDHPETVGRILIGLSKNAPEGADAISYLRKVTAQYAVKHTTLFAKLLKECSAKEAAGLIRYLADVENHAAYPEYPQIIANLRKANEARLAQQFEAAKSERMKRKGHGELRDAPEPAGGV